MTPNKSHVEPVTLNLLKSSKVKAQGARPTHICLSSTQTAHSQCAVTEDRLRRKLLGPHRAAPATFIFIMDRTIGHRTHVSKVFTDA